MKESAVLVFAFVLATLMLLMHPHFRGPLSLRATRMDARRDTDHSIKIPESLDLQKQATTSVPEVFAQTVFKPAVLVDIPNGCFRVPPDDSILHDESLHIVPPPPGPVDIVCCATTKGQLSIAVHHSWAPIGSERFLRMVEEEFFSTKVPLFRALRAFLVQFGLAGDPKVQKVSSLVL